MKLHPLGGRRNPYSLGDVEAPPTEDKEAPPIGGVRKLHPLGEEEAPPTGGG